MEDTFCDSQILGEEDAMESDWSKLPKELLELISNRLTNLTDHVRFRAVCRSWADTSPPSRVPRQMPWLLLPYHRNTDFRNFLSFSENKVYQFKSKEFLGKRCCGSSHGWLALVDGSPDISLYNPLGDEKILLPKLTTLPQVRQFRESHEYYIYREPRGSKHIVDMEFMRNFFVQRIILSGNPTTCDKDCWAVLCYDLRVWRLAFCKLGDESWTVINDQACIYTDLIFHNGKLYAVDSTERIIICDLRFPEKLTAVQPEGPDGAGLMYLTELSGALLLILVHEDDMSSMDEEEREDCYQAILRGDYRKFYCTDTSDKRAPHIEYDGRAICCSVLEFDEVEKRLVKVHSLGNYALFLSLNCSISLLASDTRGCRKNCIYFIENFKVKNGVYTRNGYELCTYSIKDGSIQHAVSLILRGPDLRCLPTQEAWYTPSCVANWMPSQSTKPLSKESALWIPNAKGNFSVKSNPPVDVHGRYSFPGPIKSEKWNALREANLSEMLLLPLWRVACGILPTKIVANIIPLPLCPLCHQVEESLEHLLLFCQYTKVVWLNSPWPLHTSVLDGISIADWINTIADSGSALGLHGIEAKKFTLFAAIFIEQIWILRNSAVGGGFIPHALHFARHINRIYCDTLKGWFFKMPNPLPGAKWVCPPAGKIKINFNAAIGLDFVMLAMTGRDHDGRFVLACTERSPYCALIVAEAKAALLAISVAINSGFDKLLVEGDAQGIVPPLQEANISPFHAISGLIGDIRSLLTTVESWCVNYVSLKGNLATHNLACWAAFYGRTGPIPVSSLPTCVVYADGGDRRSFSNFPSTVNQTKSTKKDFI